MYILGAGGLAGGGLSTILIFVVFIALMYFMMIRPQKKQQDRRKQMMSALKKGDHVVTIGGLHGVIDSIDQADKSITLDCDGVYLVFNRSAIGRVVEHAAGKGQAPAANVANVNETKEPAASKDENNTPSADDQPKDTNDSDK